MAKFLRHNLALDHEVTGLVSRIGKLPNTASMISEYIVQHSSTGHTTVTVTLYVDEKFSQVAEKEVNTDG